MNKNQPEDIVNQRARQQRSIKTRTKIISSAVIEFADHGFEAASTRQIAKNAGVQHTLINYHFKNKDGLWKAAISDLYERFEEMYTSRLSGLRGVDTSTKLRLILEDFIHFGANNPHFHWLMAHEASKGGKRMDWLLKTYIKEFIDLITSMIKEAQIEGRFVQGDPYHLLYVFVGAVSHLYMLASEVEKVARVSPSSQKFLEKHIDLCIGLFFVTEIDPSTVPPTS
ncbi:MAG: TetR/AcrR family transcriptional regulator [Parasphingorhabdus sp.]|jgi:TetR/AcrR family transcriptional regulator